MLEGKIAKAGENAIMRDNDGNKLIANVQTEGRKNTSRGGKKGNGMKGRNQKGGRKRNQKEGKTKDCRITSPKSKRGRRPVKGPRK